MKNILRTKYVAMCFATIGLLTFQSSCDEGEDYDVEGSSQNLVYVTTQSWRPVGLPDNSLFFDVTNTPIGSVISNSDRLEAKLPVKCTHPASKDVVVKFEVDNALILEGYNPLPAGVSFHIDATELVIPQGATSSSDSLTLSITSADLELLDEGAYMIPIKIASVENAKISNNLYVTRLVLETTQSNCYNSPVAADMVGTLASDRSAWSASLSVPPSSGTMGAMFDASTRTFWSLSPPQACGLTVDLAAEYTDISGIRIHTSSTAYSISDLLVSTSVDGENWQSQGPARLSRSAAYQYVRFYAPVNARYIKFDINSWISSAPNIRIADYNIYLAN